MLWLQGARVAGVGGVARVARVAHKAKQIFVFISGWEACGVETGGAADVEAAAAPGCSSVGGAAVVMLTGRVLLSKWISFFRIFSRSCLFDGEGSNKL